MLTLTLTQIEARSWRGYTKNTDGKLPKRMSWLEPKAATDFKRMIEASGNRIEFTDVYRSVFYQLQCIQGATEAKRRLYAPPTKSGHNFGMSIDVAIDETLENFAASGVNELIIASRNYQALRRWFAQYGWMYIEKERWHFDHLDGHANVCTRINDVYGQAMTLSNVDVQRALNVFVGKNLPAPLTEDGIIGAKTANACAIADKILGAGPEDCAGPSPWFRRLLAGVTATIKEV